MTGQLEPCVMHGGSVLPPAMFAPGDEGHAAVYWPGVHASPVTVGDAVDVRSSIWLVIEAASWRGDPGGVHAKLRECNAAGTLTRRPVTARSGYGVSVAAESAPVAIIGVLTVTTTTDPDGRVVTFGELIPAHAWLGGSGDLLDLVDGSGWEQFGDPIGITLPRVQLRRVR